MANPRSAVRQNEVCEEALNAALVKLESVEGGTCHAAGIDTLHELGYRAVRLEKFSPTSARSNRLAIENLYCLSAMRWCGSERERRHGHRRQLKFHAYLS